MSAGRKLFLTLPPVGRVDRPQAGRGGGGDLSLLPPTRLASLGDLPHKGGGKGSAEAAP